MKDSKKEIKITIRVDKEMNKALLSLAKLEDRILSDYIRYELKKIIKSNTGKTPND